MIIIKSIAIGKDVRIGFVKSGNVDPQDIAGNRAQMKLDFQRADNHDE